jgi:DNA-binding IscR family transcriptional regulator
VVIVTGFSLKGLIRHVSAFTGMSEATVYERQRALVRAGLLETQRGRGPGSGVRGTPESMALLLISLLATANLSEVGLSTRIFADLENKEGSCPLTGKRTFAEAVTAILASKELAQSISAINVSQEIREAQIAYRDIGKAGRITPSSSKFGGLAGQPEERGLTLCASLSGYALSQMVDIFAFDKGEARP